MERIVLEVDNVIAKAWRNITPSERAGYEAKISEVLKDIKVAEFNRLLNDAGRIAAENGLTPDKLNSLLNEED